MTRNEQIKRALQIRADAITGFYTIYDLSAKYNLGIEAVRAHLICKRCKRASAQDGYGIITLVNERCKTLTSVIKTLHATGFNFTKISTYIGCTRSYCFQLSQKKENKRRPLVPFELKQTIRTMHNNKLEAGTYYVQRVDGQDYLLIYTEPNQMPAFIRPEVLKGAKKELSDKPIIEPVLV